MHWHLLLASSWLFGPLVQASQPEVSVRTLPGYTLEDTVSLLRRRLDHVARNSESKVLFDNTTSLDLALVNKMLYEYKNENITHHKRDGTAVSAGVQISCAKCYIKGAARAKLSVNGAFNRTKVYNDVKSEAKTTLREIKRYAEEVLIGNLNNLAESRDRVPPPQIDFNVDLDFPGYDLEIEFDDIELYVQLSTVVSSGLTYTLPLYSSKNLGIALGPKFLLGAVFSFVLVLSVDDELDIDSGFHIKLDKKMTMKIALFAKEASHLQIHGGKFEFLPVTVQSGNTVLRALLRLQLRAGLSLPLIDSPIDVFDVAAGIEARVYADVAQFVTNITAPADRDGRSVDCALHVVQDYKLAVGAAAGASVALFGNTYGPSPATEIPIYYTTLAAACVTTAPLTTAAATPAATGLARRLGGGGKSSTTTRVTAVTYEVNACMSKGIMNCPASLQTVSRNVVTKTLTTTVPSGSKADWSAPAAVTAFKAEKFGHDSLPLNSVSGKPESYVPPPSPTGSSSADRSEGAYTTSFSLWRGETGGISNKLIIGVSVGVGVPALICIAGFCIFAALRRRRRAAAVLTPALSDPGTPWLDSKQKGSTVAYTAVHQEKDGELQH
ncbi:hypothetical protein ED733_004593 [Metarhizium rileyi]|uniref:Mid2 domain-containing protein n=1 Tax=Metarhizium rileyi (strain RCEF 4871) TaxID=1649241 RepID=A0A5C6GNS4_METRR|nr:hypothetical protein ED733_004593 [Metarhizium rileyi]